MEELTREAADREIQRFLDQNHTEIIGLDDTFDFKCRGCGKCCRNRNDILLTPKDVFRMSGHLGIGIESFLDTYCEVSLASGGMVVTVYLKSVGGNKRCPFLDGRKCKVHSVKPSICALYPIGRYFDGGIPDTLSDINPSPTVKYLHVQVECDHKRKKQTVREWLAKAGIPIDDTYYLQWNTCVTKVARFLHMIKMRDATDLTQRIVMEMFFQFSYLHYDLSKEFTPQFERNLREVDENIELFAEAAKSLLPGGDGGDENGQQE